MRNPAVRFDTRIAVQRCRFVDRAPCGRARTAAWAGASADLGTWHGLVVREFQ